ncbi:putative Metal dependent phosphohydrolase [Nitrospira defluvii]|jgi:putative nucleotidyltransferase with HDIG domain|uniref:Putative Metal dependent phosphohydrolase n=1 Tax=Nitrospira defluvii TaxID=330214 RepID=D8PC86_9BACT|nr:putative Metal dependent phosphohydrolase [Nitrospira defluvii]
MAYRPIDIDALQIGMHVAKIDVAWFRSPFMRHSFLIRTDEQIEKLRRAGVKHLSIDPARGLDIPGTSTSVQDEPNGTTKPLDTPSPPATEVRSLAAMTQELLTARTARAQLEASVQNTFSRIAQTGIVDPEEATHTVHAISAVAQALNTHALFMAFNQGRAGNAPLSQHALATCSFSMILAHAADYNLLAIQELATGALLHDIGLMQVPPNILQRIHDTSATLSEQNRQAYEAHARAGAILLERRNGFSPSVEQIVAEHHAYLNGSGFPAETGGAFTSDMTRIVMVTDRYDELLTGFGGASPLTPHQSLQRLYQEGQEGRYENRLISLFVKVMGIYPVYSYVSLTTGERAIVSVINSGKLHQPIVTITHDPSGQPYIVPLVIDLANQDAEAPPRGIRSVLGTIPPEFERAFH